MTENELSLKFGTYQKQHPDSTLPMLTIEGRISSDDVETVEAKITESLENNGPALLIDMQGVNFMPARVNGVLLKSHKNALKAEAPCGKEKGLCIVAIKGGPADKTLDMMGTKHFMNVELIGKENN